MVNEDNNVSVFLSNGLFYILNKNNVILNVFDRVISTNSGFYIVNKKFNGNIYYNLLLSDGTLLFDNSIIFEYISYDNENNSFNFYYKFNNNYKVVPVILPKLNNNSSIFCKIFSLYLKFNYEYNSVNIDGFQNLVNAINDKLSTLNDSSINYELLEKSLSFYYTLDCPDYLANYVLIINKEDINNYINLILNNRDILEDVKKRVSIYALNNNIKSFNLGNISSNNFVNKLYCMNRSFFDKFFMNIEDSIEYLFDTPKVITENIYNNINNCINRENILSSIYNIKNYILDNNSLHYFYKEEILAIDRNSYINLMYNKYNKIIKDKISDYFID